MRLHVPALTVGVVAVVLVVPCFAQEVQQVTPPKTKLGAFEAQAGAVIIRGFSDIGEIRGVYGGSVALKSQEFINATTGLKEYGITIDVKEGGRLERENRAFIDYDEILAFLKGIDYITKIDRASTRLERYQADYRTKDDFVVSKFSTANEDMFSIACGRVGRTSVFFKTSDMARFREIVAAAKEKIDAIKKS